MYKIQDRTPGYKGYKIGEDGNYILPRNKNGVICLYYLNCYKYGPNTLGLIDGSKIKQKDWEDLRNEFILIFPNKTFKKFYCVGGSDTGVIGGYNKYKTPDQLAKEKRGNSKEEISVDTEYKFYLGHRLEEAAALAFYEKEHKKAIHNGKFEIFTDNSVFFNITTGFMQANVDYFVEDGNGLHILECKTTANTAEWANGETPMPYITQAVFHYARCLEDLKIVSTYFSCLYNTNLKDVITREIKRDKNLEEALVKEEKKFIEYVKSGEDIPLGTFNEPFELIEKIIQKLHPKATQTEAVELPDTLEDTVTQYLAIYKEKAALESKARTLGKELAPFKNSIMEFLGDNAEGKIKLEGIDYKVDFSNKAKKWSMSSANLTALREEKPELYIELIEGGYITASEGRNFSIKEVKDKRSKKKV